MPVTTPPSLHPPCPSPAKLGKPPLPEGCSWYDSTSRTVRRVGCLARLVPSNPGALTPGFGNKDLRHFGSRGRHDVTHGQRRPVALVSPTLPSPQKCRLSSVVYKAISSSIYVVFSPAGKLQCRLQSPLSKGAGGWGLAAVAVAGLRARLFGQCRRGRRGICPYFGVVADTAARTDGGPRSHSVKGALLL